MHKARRAIHFRPFEERDAALLGRWLADAGLGVPTGMDSGAWGRRVVADPRIVCQAACAGGKKPLKTPIAAKLDQRMRRRPLEERNAVGGWRIMVHLGCGTLPGAGPIVPGETRSQRRPLGATTGLMKP